MINAGNSTCIPADKKKELTAPVDVETMLPMSKWFYNLSERTVGLVFRGIFANSKITFEISIHTTENCLTDLFTTLQEGKKLTIPTHFKMHPILCI